MVDANDAPGKPIRLSPPLDWQVELADALPDGGITVAAFVPDSRLDGIMTRLGERELPVRGLAREEECIAFAAGHRLAGLRPVVLMQCSGVGNALNALASLAIPYGIGMPLAPSSGAHGAAPADHPRRGSCRTKTVPASKSRPLSP